MAQAKANSQDKASSTLKEKEKETDEKEGIDFTKLSREICY